MHICDAAGVLSVTFFKHSCIFSSHIRSRDSVKRHGCASHIRPEDTCHVFRAQLYFLSYIQLGDSVKRHGCASYIRPEDGVKRHGCATFNLEQRKFSAGLHSK